MNRMCRFRFVVVLCALMLTSCAATMRNFRSAQLLENLGNEYYLLASLYEESGKYDKALELYRKARTAGSSKTERELTFKIARNAALAKDWDAALKEYESLLKTDSGNLLVQKSVAWIYGQKGDFDKAEQAYAALYESQPYDKDVCTNYILVLHALQKTERAREVFSSYIELYPDAANKADLEKLFDTGEKNTAKAD